MILYFSGTGNTRWIAEQMGKCCDLPVRRITDSIDKSEVLATELGGKQILGLAFLFTGGQFPQRLWSFSAIYPKLKPEAPTMFSLSCRVAMT